MSVRLSSKVSGLLRAQDACLRSVAPSRDRLRHRYGDRNPYREAKPQNLARADWGRDVGLISHLAFCMRDAL